MCLLFILLCEYFWPNLFQLHLFNVRVICCWINQMACYNFKLRFSSSIPVHMQILYESYNNKFIIILILIIYFTNLESRKLILELRNVLVSHKSFLMLESDCRIIWIPLIRFAPNNFLVWYIIINHNKSGELGYFCCALEKDA